MWGVIYIGNLILITLIFEYYNNSQYFRIYNNFLRKMAISTMSLTANRKVPLDYSLELNTGIKIL